MKHWVNWKMKSKIVSIVVSVLLLISVTLIVTNNYFTSKGFEEATEGEIISYKKVVDNAIVGDVNELTNASFLIANNSEVKSLLKSGSSPALNELITAITKSIGADEITVVNKEMKVIASAHSGSSYNQAQAITAKAVSGESNSGIDKGTDGKLSLRAAVPITIDNQVIGAVVSGFNITDNYSFVDKIKALCGVECTIFNNDERASTSIVKEGKRAVGTKMDNVKVLETVLQKDKDFINQNIILGKPFQTYYWPIKDFTGKTVGMYFIGKDRKIIESSYSNILYSSITVIVIVGLLLVFVSFYVARLIANPLNRLVSFANAISKGDMILDIDRKSNDEIGQLFNSFKEMTEGIRDKTEHLDKLAQGNLNIYTEEKSEKDLLAKSINNISNILTNVKKETDILTTAAAKGELDVRSDVTKFQGGFKEIIEGFNNTIAAIVAPIDATEKIMEEMSKGDLTVKLEGNYEGKYQRLQSYVNNLSATLNTLISDITEAVQATAASSTQISSSIEEMAAGAHEQSGKVTEVACAVEEMTRTILATTHNVSSASETAQKSGKIADSGGLVVDNTVAGMNKIAGVVNQAASIIKELGTSSQQIGEIIQVINDIADQTNLLALNAAIEAARAGEQGRGFAVVADEVRKLAERTGKATKEIAGMIKLIQTNTDHAVSAIEAGTKEVEEGKILASQAGDSLKEIIGGSKKVVDMVNQVAAASEEQSTTAEEISKNIEGINNVSRETASGIQQIARAAEDLNRLTDNLSSLITRFKTDATGNTGITSYHAKQIKALLSNSTKE
jgi:methyl-accepting chemotaxis protein